MIVMKFGGTSLGNASRIDHVARLVQSRIKEKPIIVVSAVGGMTDLLIQTALKAVAAKPYQDAFQEFIQTHKTILTTLELETRFFMEFCEELSRIYEGISLLKEFTPRTRDLVSSFGERISARIMALHLQHLKTKATALDAWEVGFITTSDFTQAKLLPSAETKIKKTLAGYNGIPVVTGFIGKDMHGNITTLGRGGSDFSASLIGAAVDAKAIEIWTDVSGIMTADPRIVPNARTLATVTFQEAAELSAFGAKVLHPKTIEPAVKKNIPVMVKNTFKPEDAGTLILSKNSKKQGAKALTLKKGITRMNIYSTGMLDSHGFLSRVFNILENFGISVDVVATSEVHISLTLDNIGQILPAKAELEKFAEVSIEEERAILCIVGEGLRQTWGIAGRAFRVLGDANINIEMISQGASQINLTFVVTSSDALKAIRLLHEEFFE